MLLSTALLASGIAIGISIPRKPTSPEVKKNEAGSESNQTALTISPTQTVPTPTPTPTSIPSPTPIPTQAEEVSTKQYNSPTKRLQFEYPSSWILKEEKSDDGKGWIIRLQGPKQGMFIFENTSPLYGFDDFTLVKTTSKIAGKTYSASKYTSDSWKNSFIDVKVQDKPFPLTVQYGDASSWGFIGYDQKYDEIQDFSKVLVPLQKILDSMKIKNS